MTIALLLMIALAGGTSFAAQNAVPGDTLYPVKVHVNENVESFVALGAEADARAEARHAIKRLQEAKKLKANNALTAETSTRLESQFTSNVKAMNEELAKLQKIGKADVAIAVDTEFRNSLKNNQDALGLMNINLNNSALGMQSNTNAEASLRVRLKNLTDDLIETEREKLRTSISLQAETEANVALQSAINAITEAESSFNQSQVNLTAQGKTEVKTKLDQANKAVADGKIRFQAKAYSDAYASFKRAERTAGEATLSLMLSLQSDVNVGNVLDINTSPKNNQNTPSDKGTESNTTSAQNSNNTTQPNSGSDTSSSGNSGSAVNGNTGVQISGTVSPTSGTGNVQGTVNTATQIGL